MEYSHSSLVELDCWATLSALFVSPASKEMMVIKVKIKVYINIQNNDDDDAGLLGNAVSIVCLSSKNFQSANHYDSIEDDDQK